MGSLGVERTGEGVHEIKGTVRKSHDNGDHDSWTAKDGEKTETYEVTGKLYNESKASQLDLHDGLREDHDGALTERFRSFSGKNGSFWGIGNGDGVHAVKSAKVSTQRL